MSNQGASSLVSFSSSSSSSPQHKYDVFLSFRGEDTRNKFIDHLYAALDQKGIVVFRDDEKLERGKAIAPELLQAIEESRFSIVVFSSNYASSRWCLDELVKIVECMSKKGQVVLPVFYDVDPFDVRKQTGSFQEAFAKHKKDFREQIKKVQEWRTAFTEVANLSGWHLQDRPEANLIQDIVKEILCKLSHTLPSVVEGLVGMYSRVKELNLCLGEGLNDVRFIGICGMGGIGKTTIARVVYQGLSDQFESSCFLVNVQEGFKKHGMFPLQNQLLSEVLMEPNINVLNVYRGVNIIRSRLQYKKVLIILDDVDKLEQLNMLAGDHSWFGPGSRIIITTRNEHLLREHGVDGIYKAEVLNDDESLVLFGWKAFKQNHPTKDYEELSKKVVNYATGLPLALEVLGSFLCGRSIDMWRSALDRLDKNPNRKILNILKVSFDGLEEMEKKIFLDVACFFRGHDKYHVTEILDACGFYPGIGIQVLIDKSLIKIIENELWMHDLLQIMGQEIVRQECIKEPGKRSRLWAYEDINHVLTKNTEIDTVEAMDIEFPKHTKVQWNADSLSKMSKLRLLKIRNVHLSQGPKCLSNELRFLEWHGYPSKCLPFSFYPDKLVELNMCYSGIKQLWKGKKVLENLKFITLCHLQNLTEMPDLTEIPNLERLILESCTRLYEVHPSIGLLKKLFLLNLKDCRSLRSLPSNINGLKSLKTLNLSGCFKLENVLENLGQVECLEELDVSGTALRQPPSFIFLLPNLKVLSFRGCKGPPSNSWLSSFPFLSMQRKSPESMPLKLPSFLGLCSLTKLDLSDCNLGEGAIPNDIGCLSSLKELNLSSNIFISLPTSISQLSQLCVLIVENCKRLRLLSEIPTNLQIVQANACTSLEMLPDPLKQCTIDKTKDMWLAFGCHSCFKLVENQDYSSMATRMLKRFLQGSANLRYRFDIVIPGDKIPEWFNYQTEGNKVTIQSSLVLNNKNKLIGFVVCSTFVPHQLSRPTDNYKQRLICIPHADDKELSPRPVFPFKEKSGQAVPNHLWLVYLRRTEHFSWFSDFDKASHIGFSIESKGLGLEVKKLGVHPINEQDVVELNQTMSQYSTSTFDKFNDLPQDFDGSAASDGTIIKRINDEVRPSGSDCFKDEPHPKRFKY